MNGTSSARTGRREDAMAEMSGCGMGSIIAGDARRPTRRLKLGTEEGRHEGRARPSRHRGECDTTTRRTRTLPSRTVLTVTRPSHTSHETYRHYTVTVHSTHATPTRPPSRAARAEDTAHALGSTLSRRLCEPKHLLCLERCEPCRYSHHHLLFQRLDRIWRTGQDCKLGDEAILVQ